MVESALAFRASEIMMRLNAPISAILALVVLFLLPATLLARPAHRAAHSHTAQKRNSGKKTRDSAAASRGNHILKRHRAKKSWRDESQVPPTVNRVHSARRGHTPASNRRIGISNGSNSDGRIEKDVAARRATSADFIRAAHGHLDALGPGSDSLHDQTSLVDKALAIKAPIVQSAGGSLRPAPASSEPAKRPTAVVEVVRPAAERAQLEPVDEAAATPVILPALYNKRGHLIVPPPLKGSREILLRQNQVADRDGLDRVQNDADLLDMRDKKMLVALPVNSGMQVDDRLPSNRRYCRPWTAQFLNTLARAHYARFHSSLQVNSAVRTVEFQQRLLRTNGNAAPADGETASPHLTGQAVDLAKHGLSLTEIAWLRGYLLPLVQEGKVDVEEEFQQSCFHISVYKKYLPAARAPKRNLASSHGDGTTALAAAIR